MSVAETNIFYIIIIFYASFMGYLYEKIKINKKKDLKVLLFISYIVMSVPVAFRYHTGADYAEYVNIYNTISKYNILDALKYVDIEPGYILLNYMCEVVFGDYKSIFIVMAFITNYFFFKAIINKSEYVRLGTSIFTYGFTLYFWGYIQIRNMLAIAIIFYAFDFIFEKKLSKFFIAVSIASMFHYSSSIFYLIGLLYNKKFKTFSKKNYLYNNSIITSFT